MGYTRVSEKERTEIFACFDAGMTEREIVSMSGRSRETLFRLKKAWKMQKEARKMDIPAVEAPASVDQSAPSMAESDYAKAYLSGDPRWANGSLNIKKSIQIESSATGFKYKMAVGTDAIQIESPDGRTLEVSIKDFEKFSNELVDVYIECTEFKKK